MRALPSDVRAAFVVRTLAFVATRMPKKPASAEHSAPTVNDSAISGLESARPRLASSSSDATTMTKMASTRYSRRRKALAPSWMSAAISAMRSVPTGCAVTQRERRKAYPSARIPAMGTSRARVDSMMWG